MEPGDDREPLTAALREQGVSEADIDAAIAEDRLVLLPLERALGTQARHTLPELAERAGVDEEVARWRLRSLGGTVPEDDEAAFSDDDVEAVRRAAEYLEHGIDLEEGRAVTHLLAGQMARVADPLRRLFAQTYTKDGDTETDLALRYAEMAELLAPLLAADLDYLLRRTIMDFARNETIGLGELPDSYDVAVAFVDIVGFTALGEELPELELTDIAERLASLAEEHVRNPVRVVKTIGDAVMIVSTDADKLVRAVLAMTADKGDLPSLRTGIAYGRAVPRLGDWYGPAVNLASRVTGRARPDAILVTSALADALTESYELSDAGHKRFKGISDPVAVKRLRSSESP